MKGNYDDNNDSHGENIYKKQSKASWSFGTFDLEPSSNNLLGCLSGVKLERN